MRFAGSFWLTLGLSALACGGNVVVDSQAQGGGGSGAGGSTSSSSGTASSSSGTSSSSSGTITCGVGTCGIGPDGSCVCEATCSGQELMVQCSPSGGNQYCQCYENSINIANCFDPAGGTCDILGGCCGDAFTGG